MRLVFPLRSRLIFTPRRRGLLLSSLRACGYPSLCQPLCLRVVLLLSTRSRLCDPFDVFGPTPLSTAQKCPGDVHHVLVVLIEFVMCTFFPFVLFLLL
jgi:hypothetical protein